MMTVTTTMVMMMMMMLLMLLRCLSFFLSFCPVTVHLSSPKPNGNDINAAEDSCTTFPETGDRLVGLMVKASTPIDSRFPVGIFSGPSHTSDLRIGTPVAALPGAVGSALGLAGPMSADCDCVR